MFFIGQVPVLDDRLTDFFPRSYQYTVIVCCHMPSMSVPSNFRVHE